MKLGGESRVDIPPETSQVRSSFFHTLKYSIKGILINLLIPRDIFISKSKF